MEKKLYTNYGYEDPKIIIHQNNNFDVHHNSQINEINTLAQSNYIFNNNNNSKEATHKNINEHNKKSNNIIEKTIENYKDKNNEFNELIKKIYELTQQLDEKNKIINELEKGIENKEKNNLSKEINQKNELISILNENKYLSNKLQEKDDIIAEKDEEIANLKEKLRHQGDILNNYNIATLSETMKTYLKKERREAVEILTKILESNNNCTIDWQKIILNLQNNSTESTNDTRVNNIDAEN